MIKKDGSETLYMAVKNDKYELPFAVFWSVEEAAEWAGITKQGVFSALWRGKKPRKQTRSVRNYKFVKVVIRNDGSDCDDEGCA